MSKVDEWEKLNAENEDLLVHIEKLKAQLAARDAENEKLSRSNRIFFDLGVYYAISTGGKCLDSSWAIVVQLSDLDAAHKSALEYLKKWKGSDRRAKKGQK